MVFRNFPLSESWFCNLSRGQMDSSGFDQQRFWYCWWFLIGTDIQTSWWRHQMETYSTLLAICAGNSPVPDEFPSQRPVTRSFDVFFDLRMNKRLSKHSRRRWFETPSHSLWHHCNGDRTMFFQKGLHDVHWQVKFRRCAVNINCAVEPTTGLCQCRSLQLLPISQSNYLIIVTY